MVNKLVLLVKEENNISFDTIRANSDKFLNVNNNKEIKLITVDVKKNVSTKTKEDIYTKKKVNKR